MSGRAYAAGLPALLARRALERFILRDLRRTFRRVVWAGPAPPSLPDGPVVLYANHHYVHDTYLLWLVAGRTLGRPALVWMEEWGRVPVFAPLGALPFPPAEPRIRASTMRTTARTMRADPRTVLFLYPEGAIGPPEAGLAPLRADFGRLARVLPESTWWVPAAVHVSWWGETRPTALVVTGAPHRPPDGSETERLETLMASLRNARKPDLERGSARLLLDGRRGADEWADLRFAEPLFRRALRRLRG